MNSLISNKRIIDAELSQEQLDYDTGDEWIENLIEKDNMDRRYNNPLLIGGCIGCIFGGTMYITMWNVIEQISISRRFSIWWGIMLLCTGLLAGKRRLALLEIYIVYEKDNEIFDRGDTWIAPMYDCGWLSANVEFDNDMCSLNWARKWLECRRAKINFTGILLLDGYLSSSIISFISGLLSLTIMGRREFLQSLPLMINIAIFLTIGVAILMICWFILLDIIDVCQDEHPPQSVIMTKTQKYIAHGGIGILSLMHSFQITNIYNLPMKMIAIPTNYSFMLPLLYIFVGLVVGVALGANSVNSKFIKT